MINLDFFYKRLFSILEKHASINALTPYRIRTREIPMEQAHKLVFDPTKLFLRKDDGVQVTYLLHAGKPPVAFTPKPSVSGEHINRTEQLQLPKTKIPHELNGTIAHGEVLLLDSDGKALPLKDTVGYMNMEPNKGKQYLKDNGYQIYRTVFDVDRIGNKDISTQPFKYRLEAVKAIAPIIDADVPEHSATVKGKLNLLNSIRAGKNKKTNEGIVIQDLNNFSGVLKAKNKKVFDVIVTGIVPSKNLPGAAGGFEYSYDGKTTVGKVGTGFSIKERIEMMKNPTKYIGRYAVVQSIGKTPNGVLFQPSFISWHPEKGRSIWSDIK